MATENQIRANQANAQLSTGARTPEGHAASAQNRLTHGFTGRFTILGWESQEEYDTLLADTRGDQKPEGLIEQAYVDQIAQNLWLRQRALILQSMLLDTLVPKIDQEKTFALYLRYQTTAERNFDRCVNQLLKLRKEKQKAEIGFESQKRREQAQEIKETTAETKKTLEEIERECFENMYGPLPDGSSLSIPTPLLSVDRKMAKQKIKNACQKERAAA